MPYSAPGPFLGAQSASTAYQVSRSLRFRSSASAYLSRTFGTPTNGKKYTISFWAKLSKLGDTTIMNTGSTGATGSWVYINSSNQINFNDYCAGSRCQKITTPVYRDPSAWYHIVCTLDTTVPAMKVYVNGSEVTAFGTNTAPTSNANSSLNANSAVVNIGRDTAGSSYFDGYLAETYLIDGQALTPSSFGAYDTNGVWQPAAYTGSYGTNGFYLKFTDVGATSGSNTGYGKDFAGTNYWTTTNFGTTSTDTTYDSMLDSPTNAAGDIGNYCVISPINSYSSITISNANLTATLTEAAYRKAVATMAFPTSGKYYVEAKLTGINYASFGVVTPTAPLNDRVGATATGYGVVTGGTQWDKWDNGTSTGNFWSISTTSPTLQIAIDTTNGKLWIGYNDTWLDGSGGLTGNPAAGTNATFTIDTSRVYLPAVGGYKSDSIAFDFTAGQRPFTYTPPSGFSALNTQNLPTPTITNGAQYMAATTYTGNGSTQTITNGGNNNAGTTFQPDFVWLKDRVFTYNHGLYDAVRGVQNWISSSSTSAENAFGTGELTAFNSNGFTLVNSANYENNKNSDTYIAWQWNAGGSNATNTSGSITSTVRANTTAGFSVVTFTQPSASPWTATVGHGLGVAPSMIIYKDRSAANNWLVYHSSLGATQYLYLSATNAATTGSNAFNNTAPTSTVFTTTAGSTFFGNSGATCVAYCFAPVAGYSAFGSYTGNASTDGPFVYTGFRPRYVMIKRTDTTSDWTVFDTSRNSYNVSNLRLWANLSDAESSTSSTMDILSNGFKLRTSDAFANASGGTYIYAAFAEIPFKIARAR